MVVCTIPVRAPVKAFKNSSTVAREELLRNPVSEHLCELPLEGYRYPSEGYLHVPLVSTSFENEEAEWVGSL